MKKKIALSLPTFACGLTELESAQIIAKHLRQGWYFINPNLIFNGDRIAFTTVIQRRRNEKKDDSTLDMFDDSNE
ncbi:MULTISPECIES: replication/maintenance protein RepL [unclassified Bartonella]|uniref:replication/maintenance protein RepL n=1 Tax=unclassified Bartonella TaxID=2645622 RepID=UPI0031842A58